MTPAEFNSSSFYTNSLPHGYSRDSDKYRAAEFEKDFGGLSYQDFSGVLTGTLGATYILDNSSAHSTIGFHLTIPSGGQVQFEGSYDDSHYSPIQLRELSSNGYIQSSEVSEDYIGSVAALRKIRFNVISGGAADGSVAGRLCKDVSTLEGIENSAPPHRFGNTLFHKGFSLSATTASNTVVYTPPAYSKFVISYISFGASSPLGANIIFHETPDTGVNSNNWVFSTYLKSSATDTQFFNAVINTPFVASGTGTSFCLTVDASTTLRGVVHGYYSRI